MEKEKKTHLNAKEPENKYGSRVRSRLRAMFNLISFNQNSIDKKNKNFNQKINKSCVFSLNLYDISFINTIYNTY